MKDTNYAIILAGGYGVRMGSANVPKQFIEIAGIPLIVYSMHTAQLNKNIDEVCVVTHPQKYKQVSAWAREYGISKFKYLAESGQERHQSVFNGLIKIPANKNDSVMIMTSVCAFVSQRTINKHFELLQKNDGCITVVKATDAITLSSDGKYVNRTMQKDKMYVQQGPQTFRYGILRKGHEFHLISESKRDVHEDSEIVLNTGVEVRMVLGDRFCIKVTYPEDLAIAESLIELFRDKEGQIGPERVHRGEKYD